MGQSLDNRINHMLYIVGTPIGNLEDLSIRQAKTLSSVDIILAEDTRSAGILLKKIQKLLKVSVNPSQRFISYYREKEFEKLPEVLNLLKAQKNIALISESGMPLISDPGELLIKEVIKKNLTFTVIPGPTAAVTALIHSGFKTNKFMFFGFIPKKESEILKLIEKLKQFSQIDKDLAYIFYESPNRINRTLELLDKTVPIAEVIIARELTKKFEEVIRGAPKELKNKSLRGEITILLSL